MKTALLILALLAMAVIALLVFFAIIISDGLVKDEENKE